MGRVLFFSFCFAFLLSLFSLLSSLSASAELWRRCERGAGGRAESRTDNGRALTGCRSGQFRARGSASNDDRQGRQAGERIRCAFCVSRFAFRRLRCCLAA